MLQKKTDDGIAASVEIIVSLRDYLTNTDLPILAEYCANHNYPVKNVLAAAAENKIIDMFITLIETKKRAALERMIYTGQLNATIGLHLLKTWQDYKIPPQELPPTWIEMLTPEEAKKYHELTHKANGLSTVREKRPELAGGANE